jgi:type II secretory pathway pseudopilin PulG
MEKLFTVLEILTVIIIIAVMAAIALPKYKLNEEKKLAASALREGKAVMAATNRYYEQNAKYPVNVRQLSIGFECPKGFNCFYNIIMDIYDFQMEKETGSYNYGLIFHLNESRRHRAYCYAEKKDKKANQICKELSISPDAPTEKDEDYFLYKI